MKAKNKLGIVFFPAFDWEISPTHPERQERLLYTMDQLKEEGIEDIEGIELYNPAIATNKDIERVHFVVPNVDHVVTESHKVSIGGTIKAFQLLLDKKVDKSFAMVRPPGHHAFRVVYGDRGFCIVNVEAVALEHIRSKRDLKVAIIDTDAHHGDGTQDIYWNDPDTLFISMHQDGRTLFPGSGFVEDMGGPGGFGYNINIPLPPYTGDEGMHYIIKNVVLPILEDYQPDIIINSAGQDNHYSDPLTNMSFSAQGYGHLNKMLDPDIAVLEGGYEVEGALPYVNLGIVLAMAGLDYSGVVEPDYNPSKVAQSSEVTEYIKVLGEQILSNWHNKTALKEEQIGDEKIVTRDKRIYYDTAGILENQRESIVNCPDCPGLEIIDSRSDTGYHVLALAIPKNPCRKCRETGYKKYEEAKNYTNVYLQDKEKDKYHYK